MHISVNILVPKNVIKEYNFYIKVMACVWKNYKKKKKKKKTRKLENGIKDRNNERLFKYFNLFLLLFFIYFFFNFHINLCTSFVCGIFSVLGIFFSFGVCVDDDTHLMQRERKSFDQSAIKSFIHLVIAVVVSLLIFLGNFYLKFFI